MKIRKRELDELAKEILMKDSLNISIGEELENWLVKTKSISILEAQEYVELYYTKLKHLIKVIIVKHQDEYTTPKYMFSDYDDDKLRLTILSIPKSEREVVVTKINWREKINALLSKIDWREFEFLIKLILELNGITNIVITKGQKDQGIDFYGILEGKNFEDKKRFVSDLKIRIVGQAKHSSTKNNVGHAKVSSFGTEISRIRKKAPPKYFEFLPDDFFQSNIPVVGLFITNSFYWPKAVDFSQEYGIIYWNGMQISEDLAVEEFISKIIEEDNETLNLDKLKEEIKKLKFGT